MGQYQSDGIDLALDVLCCERGNEQDSMLGEALQEETFLRKSKMTDIPIVYIGGYQVRNPRLPSTASFSWQIHIASLDMAPVQQVTIICIHSDMSSHKASLLSHICKIDYWAMTTFIVRHPAISTALS